MPTREEIFEEKMGLEFAYKQSVIATTDQLKVVKALHNHSRKMQSRMDLLKSDPEKYFEIKKKEDFDYDEELKSVTDGEAIY